MWQRQDLSRNEVEKPKVKPISVETILRVINWPMITKGVSQSKVACCRFSTVPNSTIDTMSLRTPSPKRHEKSFGYYA